MQYGGQYKSTDGFNEAECDGSMQSRNKIGFWCDYDTNGAVLMIGGASRNSESLMFLFLPLFLPLCAG